MLSSHELRGIHRGQVTDVHPEDNSVSVVLVNFARAEGIRVKVTGERRHMVAGNYALPEVSDWGLIAFTNEDTRSGYWFRGIDDTGRNLYPKELLAADPHAELDHSPSDLYTVRHGDGSSETVYPDGSFLKLTTGKDGSMGNASLIGKLLTRFRSINEGMGHPAQREGFQGQRRAPVDVLFRHSSGATVSISADGRFALATPGGHTLTLDDGQEKIRDPQNPLAVTGTPGAGLARSIRLVTSSGHSFTMDDHGDAVSAVTAGGLSMILNDAARTVTVHGETVVVDAAVVKLGSAGASKLVVLNGDTGIDPDGSNVTVQSSATKVFAE